MLMERYRLTHEGARSLLEKKARESSGDIVAVATAIKNSHRAADEQ